MLTASSAVRPQLYGPVERWLGYGSGPPACQVGHRSRQEAVSDMRIGEVILLSQLGLSGEAEAIYEFLLSHSVQGVPDVVRVLGMTEQQVCEGVEELLGLRLIRQLVDQPGKFRALPPNIGLTALVTRQESNLRGRLDQLAATRSALEPLIAKFAAFELQEPRPSVEQLTETESVRCRVETLALECKEEVLTFSPFEVLAGEGVESSKVIDEAVLTRGVQMRTVYLASTLNDPSSAAYVRGLVDQGAQIRTVPVSPPSMVVYDRAVAVVPVDPSDLESGALVLRGAGPVTALCELFILIWESAVEFGAPLPENADGLTPQEQAVLQLLAQGYTDDAVARKLGVSVRTSRRITAAIAQRLGVRSRFQAGAEAEHRGWLSRRAGDLCT